MNENAEKYLKVLKKHIDRVVIVVLYLFLGTLIYVWYSEQEKEGVSESGKIAKIDDPVTQNPFWASLQTMSQPQQIESYPAIMQIRQYNMFDYKSVRQAADLLRDLNQKFQQAQDAEKAGKKDDAIRLLKNILQQKPSYRPARELLDKLEPKAPAAEAPASEGPA